MAYTAYFCYTGVLEEGATHREGAQAVKYQVYSEDSQVIGHSILSMVECVRADIMKPLLEKCGLETIDPERWYPLQSWLNVFNELEAGGMTKIESFVSVGMTIVETAVLPPEFDRLSFDRIIEMIDYAYKMNNRGTEIGEYKGETVSPRHVRVTITAPYPDDYNYGILYGFARRYLGRGHFTVFYDDTLPRREEGGKNTVIHVVWE